MYIYNPWESWVRRLKCWMGFHYDLLEVWKSSLMPGLEPERDKHIYTICRACKRITKVTY